MSKNLTCFQCDSPYFLLDFLRIENDKSIYTVAFRGMQPNFISKLNTGQLRRCNNIRGTSHKATKIGRLAQDFIIAQQRYKYWLNISKEKEKFINSHSNSNIIIQDTTNEFIDNEIKLAENEFKRCSENLGKYEFDRYKDMELLALFIYIEHGINRMIDEYYILSHFETDELRKEYRDIVEKILNKQVYVR